MKGAPGAEVQRLFRLLAERWRPALRLAGVLAEDHGLPGRACSAGYLVSLADAERFRMFQEPGADPAGCHLAAPGVVAAAQAVRRDIAAGCDLVLLSKFGKLEKEGAGLRAAFVAAIEADVPLLTSVSGALAPAWEAFAGSKSVTVEPTPERIEAWWLDARPTQRRPGQA